MGEMIQSTNYACQRDHAVVSFWSVKTAASFRECNETFECLVSNFIVNI